MSSNHLPLALAAVAQLDPNVVVPATLTLIGVLGAAWLASRAARSRRKPHEPEAEPPVVAPSPLANFAGTQNEFMALVIKDNEAIREELGALRTEVAGLRTELAGARAEVDESKRSHGRFEQAVRRYLELLAAAWPGPETMPWPAEDDLGILEHTLTRRRRQTPRSN